MGLSRQEEIICVLWIIAGFIACSLDFIVVGWVFMAKASFEVLASVYFGIKEIAILKQEVVNGGEGGKENKGN